MSTFPLRLEVPRGATRRAMENLASVYPYLQVTATAAVLILSAVLSFLIRFDFQVPEEYSRRMPMGIAICVVVECAIYLLAGSHKRHWRHSPPREALTVTSVLSTGCLAGPAAAQLMMPGAFPKSVVVLNLLLCLVGLAAVRLLIRFLRDVAATPAGQEAKRTLVCGPYEVSAAVIRDLHHSHGFRVVGLLEDKGNRRGQIIDGVPILGAISHLREVLLPFKVDQVIFVGNAEADDHKDAIAGCLDAGVDWLVLPSTTALISNRDFAAVRKIRPEELLNRDPVQLDPEEISHKLTGKVVMVTGAAGSIGSELCRQISRFSPKAIVGYDISETALFFIEQEMQSSYPAVPFHACIGSIQNIDRLSEVFARYCPEILYHAAAYKHVPLMEQHIIEAVENNILGTADLIRTAGQFGIRDFVMVSTDKAVRPTSLMGVTKRVAELVVRSLAPPCMKAVSVRFGNVLGSNGSVIQIFKEQIAQGGPVRVTHPEMTRYFMTIPEASQLVLQASTLGEENEIFVLDMGEPVKIVSLAERMIRLAGHKPGVDIPIVFSGMRPGEKLYEELHLHDELTLPTGHEKIKIFAGSQLPAVSIRVSLEQIRRHCRERSISGLLRILQSLVPDYTPSERVRNARYENEAISVVAGPAIISVKEDSLWSR